MSLEELFAALTYYQSRNFYHYVVQPGDTQVTVAERLGVRRSLIQQWNCVPGGIALVPGTILMIPCIQAPV